MSADNIIDLAARRHPSRRTAMQPRQTIDVDTLVRAALNARHTWDQASDVVDLIGRAIPYLLDSGVNVTCDGRPYRPLSLQSWGRLVNERGLLADDERKPGPDHTPHSGS